MSKKIKKIGLLDADQLAESHPSPSRWNGLGRGKKITVIGFCLLLAIGALGAGLGSKIRSVLKSQSSASQIGQAVHSNGSEMSSLNPAAAPPLPTGTPQLAKEYIYAGSRMLAVEDAVRSLEADVQGRPSGDGFVDSDDIQQIRSFSVGGGLPYQSNEAQRADCSPRSTSGDGFLDGDDVQQARRYSIGMDALQLAGGPTTVTASLLNNREEQSDSTFAYAAWERPAESAAAQLLPTVVRIQTMTGNTGTRLVVPVRVDASGGEAVFGFSLSYDAAKLSNPVVTIGTAGGDVITNITPTTPNANPIGFSITNFEGGTLRAGVNQLLVSVRFDVAPNTSAGTVALRFDDVAGTRIARRKVVGVDPLVPLPAPVFTNGLVTIIKQVIAGYN